MNYFIISLAYTIVAAWNIELTQTSHLVYTWFNLTSLVNNDRLVIQLDQKSKNIPLLLMVKFNSLPTFYYDEDLHKYIFNADFFDFEAWSQNFQFSYISIPKKLLSTQSNISVGIFSEENGFAYQISAHGKDDRYCEPSCNNGGVCSLGSCTCINDNWGYDCSVPFSEFSLDENQLLRLEKSGDWKFFYFNPSQNPFTVKCEKIQGDSFLYFTHYENKHELPSMLYKDFSLFFDSSEALKEWNNSENSNDLWLFSVFCKDNPSCELKILIENQDTSSSNKSDGKFNWLTLVISFAVCASVLFCVIPIGISLVRRCKKWKIGSPDELAVWKNALTPKVMQKFFPSYKWRELDKEKTSCTICLDELKNGEKVRKLACEHIYHMKCIDSWIQNKSDCPLCKQLVREVGKSEETLETSMNETVIGSQSIRQDIVIRGENRGQIDTEEEKNENSF
ncbi:unnamed protein product [Blepharisma stoltei]|uniref:RING-type domain-containing protein n=1 Tax=Blepharisma stoltei TaxID=1481888 RepID=A0AAU9J5X1_9CILI|nr:unnamed protein product [Blepharisma stoltei]